MFTAAFFVRAPNCKQPKCPSILEEMNKLGYTSIYTTDMAMNHKKRIHT